MSATGHPSDAQLTDDLRKAVVGIHRVRWTLTGAMAALVIGAITAGSVTVTSQQSQLRATRQQVTTERQQLTATRRALAADEARLRASCAFYHDIATIPIVVTPPAKRPSELGVAIVLHSGAAYAGQGCGRLPAEPAALRQWSAYYHLRP